MRTSCRKIFKNLQLLPFSSVYILQTLIFFNYSQLFPPNLQVPNHSIAFFNKSLICNGIRLYNNLPENLKTLPNLNKFKREVSNFLREHT